MKVKRIKEIWNEWQKLVRRATAYQSKFLLDCIYFIFILPVAIIFKFYSDPLNLKGKPSWIDRTADESKIEQLRNQ